MAHLRCDFFSDVLGLSTSMTVLLPQRTSTQIGMAGGGDGPPPVLYLLHGLSDDDTTWLRRTSIERYAAALGLAVVMPQVHRSFYADQAAGGRYWTFLSEELPEIVGAFFRVSDRREDTFVAGLSMGGYGALRWALRAPERFAAAASLSGALDVTARLRPRPEDPHLFARVFGDEEVAGSPHDLHALLEHSDAGVLPGLYLCCGTEDPLLGENEAFRDACRAAGVPLRAEFSPGEHEWGYWDARIQDVLAWLPLRPGAGPSEV
ncbi:alpha/beta hydrolase family protein [Pseudonocardia sp. MH-G8]|uniref:alpha/beta hydrolase n=1 Tax=Pseudonocardia sp. MH-G8 TaxID=1854588 RepID=UPI000BA01D8E|nr:alpha/beta hydrolase family protein [Pseudonocardia sp. MH-G8]OZM81466.1 esterase [Pseudonocardia sp. MH-G8]